MNASAPPAKAAPRAAAARRVSLRQRIEHWWQARLPRSDSWVLGQRNIYILPTRAGLTFAATMVVMLIASINYQLNLGYALTFLLAGAGLVSMHLTHSMLRGLTLHLRPATPGFAGEPTLLDVVITNPGVQRHGLALHFHDRSAHGPAFAWCDVPAQGQESVRVSIVPARRGWHDVPTLVVETVFPFGLFRAWSLWRPATRVLAWPRPEHPAQALPDSSAQAGGESPVRRGAGGELDGVRPWRRGDTMRQVMWKKLARSGELVSRETAAANQRELWLDWAQTAGADVEQRLSRLSAWIVQADTQGLACGLRLPGEELPPGVGDAHKRAALDRLALWN